MGGSAGQAHAAIEWSRVGVLLRLRRPDVFPAESYVVAESIAGETVGARRSLLWPSHTD